MEMVTKKAEGCVKVDSLGRIYIRMAIRKELGIDEGDGLAVSINNNIILLKKSKVVKTERCVLPFGAELKIKLDKDSNVVRKVDEIGRYVLPIEIREKLGIKENDELCITTDNDFIKLEKKAS